MSFELKFKAVFD